ncbi:MAG: chitobiase/beta-hexosaminidase C-terminal domain-containing protein, partial [Pontiellaceae bacterium]|nr:chitobiase/beta-hexosaminidase C-terminal domain-containing protein [Pontiellaceae bacterium]
MYLRARRTALFLLSSLCFIAPLPASVAAVYISEIMPNNGGSLIDIDGEESDWIELYNDSESAVDLTGWYLTDSETDLTQWAFPATTIPAKEYLIVFASGKDSVQGELHAGFKLSNSGEQVLLVQPDGTTVVDQQVFPAMAKDVSFGYAFKNGIILDSGAACKAHVPTNSTDSSGWNEISFDDSSWLSGTTGVGFDSGPDYRDLIGLKLPMTAGRFPVSAYIRVPFSVTSAVHSLVLKMKYDDGFVAYLNGTPVQTANAPEPLAWDSKATLSHNNSLAIVFEEYDLTQYLGLLNEGNNILAIHGLNLRNVDGDMLILPQIEVEYDDDIDPSFFGLFASPTPGAENETVVYDGFLETPVAYPERGFYDEPIQVTLSNVTAGATIRYTTDGSEPTASSTVYTGPITIFGTTPLRTKAFMDGWKTSFSRTDTYIFLDDVIAKERSTTYINSNPVITGMDPYVLYYKTYYDANGQLCTVRDALLDIPTISVVTENENLFDARSGIYVNPDEDWEKAASVELINPDGSEGFQINSGLRIRGGWSRHEGYPKHAFRLFFRKSYGTGKLKYPLFEDEGVDEFDKIDLATAQNYCWSPGNSDDPTKNTFLRDIFARDSSRDMGAAYTRSRYYHLYLNGVYWGIYLTEERPEDSYAAAYYGGDESDYDVVKSTSWRDTEPNSISATEGNLDAYQRLYQAAMKGFANNADYFAVLGLDSNGRPDPTKEKLVDINELMDYLLVIYYTGASDNNITVFINNQLNNLYGIYNRVNPDGFKWIQHDCEHSLDTSTQLNRTGPFRDSHLSQFQYFNPQTLHEKLLANAEYRIAFADRVYKHLTNNGALTQARCEARLEARQAQIDRAIIANAARWGGLYDYYYDEWEGEYYLFFLDRDTWLYAIYEIRDFFVGRENDVIRYLKADNLLPTILPPTLSHAGGLIDPDTQVTISAAQGTIYYTVDGTDPRAIGGAIQGTAYTGPLSFEKPTILKARAW